jgi:RNA recognition motif-containing protein
LLDRTLRLAYAQRRSRKPANDDIDVGKQQQSTAATKTTTAKTTNNKEVAKAKKTRGRLIVRNLAFNATDTDLRCVCVCVCVFVFLHSRKSNSHSNCRAVFAPHGTLVDVMVAKNSSDGKPRGFGFVEFENEEQAMIAMEKGESLLLLLLLLLDCCCCFVVLCCSLFFSQLLIQLMDRKYANVL